MKYILALLTVVALVAVLLLASNSRVPVSKTTQGAQQPVAVQLTALPIQPTLDVPPEVATMTSREALVTFTTKIARSMGERDPVLLDHQLTSMSGAIPLIHLGPEERGNIRLPDDSPVLVVRMTGSFMPLRGPRQIRNTPPKPGTMYVLYDAKTGEKLSSGYEISPE